MFLLNSILKGKSMSKENQTNGKSNVAAEIAKFRGMITSSRSLKVDPCFMTGRACVYSKNIQEQIHKKSQIITENIDDLVLSGFMITPFRANLNMFFNNCLKPFIEAPNNYRAKIETANAVRRPGIIICEGICKRIQETDFIIADISLPNSNVFYELGLAFGLNQKIVVIYKSEPDLLAFQEPVLSALYSMGCEKPLRYQNLDPLTLLDDKNEGNKVNLSEHVWQNRVSVERQLDDHPILLFDSNLEFIPAGNEAINFPNNNVHPHAGNPGQPPIIPRDITIPFDQHIMSAVGIAVNTICTKIDDVIVATYKGQIERLKSTINISERPPKEIKDFIDKCYCLIVRTGGRLCNPFAYFWLGYCHATGKNVVPVTAIEKQGGPIKDLAFDIRAQRHITFAKNRPDMLELEIMETLKLMIYNDFKEWSRKKFWNRIIGSGDEISIFVGALHSNRHDREMIGDWDLLTVSELTSFFGRHQYRFKIEPPIYPPETAYQEEERKREYITTLEKMLEDKNCIIIASPDVNPLTEIVLGQYYKIPKEQLFTNPDIPTEKRKLIAYKGKPSFDDQNPSLSRVFYKEEKIDNNLTGFVFGDKQFLSTPPRYSDHPSEQPLTVFGNLLIFRNPYQRTIERNKYIILLNGVGGPSTYALTHVLTGGEGREFANYPTEAVLDTRDGRESVHDSISESNAPFHPQTASEKFLSEILEVFTPDQDAIECIIKVTIEKAKSLENERQTIKISDWRRIVRWEKVPNFNDEFTLKSANL